MYSPAEDPIIDKFLDDQADKLGSYDAAWSEAEARFGVVRPVIGDAATFGAGIEKPDLMSWDVIADREGSDTDYQSPERVAERTADHALHAANNRLTGVMSEQDKQAQQIINARRPKMHGE